MVFVPLIKNDNMCQPVKLNDQTIMIRNTCAFDCLLHIIVHTIGLSRKYKSILESKNNSFFKLALKISHQGKMTVKEYSERASYLLCLNILEDSKYTRRFETLNAMCNAAHLTEIN